MSYCVNDMAARQHAAQEGELSAQEQALEQELERMGRDRHPSLLIALEDRYAAAVENGCDTLLEMFYEQWVAGNPLAHAAVPESDICDALKPYWEAVQNDEY